LHFLRLLHQACELIFHHGIFPLFKISGELSGEKPY
jgi:hypothetical protein